MIIRFNIRPFPTLALAKDNSSGSSCAIAIAGAQQLVDNDHMAILSRDVWRRPAVIACRFNVRSMVQLLVDNLHVCLYAGLVKRRMSGAVTILGVHISSNTQKPTDLWQVLVLLSSRIDQF
jgi:hypothetical protein